MSFNLRRAIVQEHSLESQLTRSVLEVVPDRLLDYQVSPDLHTIRWNVGHLVDIPDWTDMILQQSCFDVAPPGEPPHATPEFATMSEALSAYDRHVKRGTEILESFDLESLEDEWSLLAGGQPILTKPRHLIYRMYLINHVAHHRGHLLVYLRTNGVETPSLYG